MLSPMVEFGKHYRDVLSSGHKKAAIWGLGYIGWSTAEALLDTGVQVLGHDVSQTRLETVSKFVHTRTPITFTSDPAEALAKECIVHFVAVPTERQAEPYLDALIDVMSQIVAAVVKEPRAEPPLVIIESTVVPGTVDRYILPMLVDAGLTVDVDLLIALAPRRDWFLTEGYTLKNLDRVYCGVGPVAAQAAQEVLSLMCDTLHRAPGHVEGELVKCVENAYRHLEITLANQLTLAFPSVDMVEVLRLASSKWNVGLFHPSFGTGGYCIPLSSRYLLRGSDRPEELSLLSQAVETDDRMRTIVAESVSSRGLVVILGLAYKGGIKVSTLSPTLGIARRLSENGVPYVIFDPMYSSEEIERIVGPGKAVDDLASAVRQASTILVVPDHAEFREERYTDLLNEYRPGQLLVLDNHGVMQDVGWKDHVVYRRAGHPYWLENALNLEPQDPS